MEAEFKFNRILRGCLACYVVGLFLIGGPILYWSYLTDFDDLVLHFVWVAGVGAFLAGMISVVVALIWTVLAMAQVGVHFIWVPVFTALLTGSLMGFTVVSLFLGAIFGLTFWLGAFGLTSRVVIGFQNSSVQGSASDRTLTNDLSDE